MTTSKISTKIHIKRTCTAISLFKFNDPESRSEVNHIDQYTDLERRYRDDFLFAVVFIRVGSEFVERTWIHSKGSFVAASGDGLLYKLRGKKDLSTSQFPKQEAGLLDGELVYR